MIYTYVPKALGLQFSLGIFWILRLHLHDVHAYIFGIHLHNPMYIIFIARGYANVHCAAIISFLLKTLNLQWHCDVQISSFLYES
jgi:hypothetical protein